jgi:hypothetical protein
VRTCSNTVGTSSRRVLGAYGDDEIDTSSLWIELGLLDDDDPRFLATV